ncbi:MAG: hypothetical protein M1334_02050 [Patescibacteria group bacterium]|nr:hypothetical protein [Patescibacteria group bacterium]
MKSPEFRVVGKASEEEKIKIKEKLKQKLINNLESLTDEEKEIFYAYEKEKTEEEMECVDFANKETDRLMEEAGVEPYDIPAENYHILGKGASYGELLLSDPSFYALTYYPKQEMIFRESAASTPLAFGALALHETLHLKAHYALIKNNNSYEQYYRAGVDIFPQKQDVNNPPYSYFTWLHESIVSKQVTRSLPFLLNIPALKKEKEWLESDKAKILRKAAAEAAKISESEILLIGKDKKFFRDQYRFKYHPYRDERKILDYVLEEIQKGFPDKYKDADEVFKEFLKAHFSGRIVTIANLVEKTFGKGSFRFLGSMEKYQEDAPIKQFAPEFISILATMRSENIEE